MRPLNAKKLIMPYNENGELNSTGYKLFQSGAEILKSGKNLGVVILSGGEGTRLGLSYPKGLFKIEGLTLFEWHLKRLQNLHEKYNAQIYLFIMTSESTDTQVKEFFSKHTFSFLKGIDIFKQNSIEALDIKTRQPLMKDGKTVMNPLGNGDFFQAIKKSKNKDKVEAFNVISVDNVLANILDEVYLGSFYERKLDVLSKAVKALKNESVGAFMLDGKTIKIEEYSESKNKDHVDVYGNICNHIFSAEFVNFVGTKDLPLHEAHKKIPYTETNGQLVKPTSPNGIKRERFIFDSFEYTEKNGVMVVNRNAEFAPLKNSAESPSDNPLTCAEAIKKSRIFKKSNTVSAK